MLFVGFQFFPLTDMCTCKSRFLSFVYNVLHKICYFDFLGQIESLLANIFLLHINDKFLAINMRLIYLPVYFFFLSYFSFLK